MFVDPNHGLTAVAVRRPYFSAGPHHVVAPGPRHFQKRLHPQPLPRHAGPRRLAHILFFFFFALVELFVLVPAVEPGLRYHLFLEVALPDELLATAFEFVLLDEPGLFLSSLKMLLLDAQRDNECFVVFGVRIHFVFSLCSFVKVNLVSILFYLFKWIRLTSLQHRMAPSACFTSGKLICGSFFFCFCRFGRRFYFWDT